MVNNSQEYRLKYWATRSSVCSFPRTAHSFACSGLLASLAPSAALTRLLARSLRSLHRSWERGFFLYEMNASPTCTVSTHCVQGGLPRKLCAKVGEFTREYLDETDLRIGGCYYSWRLELFDNPKAQIPQYFRDTQICHRWHANGDAGQCNSGRRDGTNCARVSTSRRT